MKGRNSTVLTVRVPDDKVILLKNRAAKMGLTINSYILHEITRSHKKIVK
jgi:predicted DNA binding CopG/RHH family protein